MLVKYGFLTGVSLVVALIALWVIEPQTRGGQALLTVIVLALVNGVGAIAVRKK